MKKLSKRKKISKSSVGITVNGIDDCLIKLSRCCAPLPGDHIIGFITRGHGVSIHKRDCNNVPMNLLEAEQPDRWVSAKWDNSGNESFKSTLSIQALDRPSMLADITVALANMRLPIHTIHAREIKGGNCEIVVTISIENLTHLSTIISKVSKIDGVYSVDRSGM